MASCLAWPLLSSFLALCLLASAAGAQTFLTEQQALELAFPRQGRLTTEERRLGAEEREKIEKSAGLRFPEPSYKFFVNHLDGRVDAYALILNEIGKSEPITFMVAVDASGKVRDVGLMVFRESRGWEVRERRFMNQFRGKRARSPLRVNQDVLNYTGATLSSQAIARGVKKALVLVQHFYGVGQAFLPVLPAGPYRELRLVMGSPARITLYAENQNAAQGAFDAAFAELERLDALLSNYRPSSELSRVNHEAARRPVRVSAELFNLLRESERISAATDGAFDITVAPLLHGGSRRCVGYRNVLLDDAARTVRFTCPATELDLGGIGKGYAAERAAQVLAAAGIRRALLNVGGSSLFALGTPPGSPGWPVAIENTGELVLLGPGQALSTSGNYQRSHIYDPRTGRPASPRRLATVICRSGALSDALTKPLLLESSGRLRAAFPDAQWLVLEAEARSR